MGYSPWGRKELEMTKATQHTHRVDLQYQFQQYSIMIQYICTLYSIIDYYKVMAIIPCAIQHILVAYLFYKQQFVNPIPLICTPSFPLTFGYLKFIFCICEFACFGYTFTCIIFQILCISDKYLSLTYFTKGNILQVHLSFCFDIL